jgi:hypothetical protein
MIYVSICWISSVPEAYRQTLLFTQVAGRLGQVYQSAFSDAEHVLSYLLFGSPISSCFRWKNPVTRQSVFAAAWGIRTGLLSLTERSGALTGMPVGESFAQIKY